VAVSHSLARIAESLRPFLAGMLDPAVQRAMADPEACDFLAGNPEEPALPGYVEALQRWTVPRHRRWFAYGMPETRGRGAAAAGLLEELGLEFDPEDILLTRGAHGALGLAFRMLTDPGDEVVFVSPPWFFYEAMILGAGATPVRVRADMKTFDVDLAALEAALTPRTRMVLINTPNNPTGRIYPAETLQGLAEILRRHSEAAGRPVYLVSDEAYSRVLFDGNRMLSPAGFYDHSLLIHTYSKSVLAPGQRLGYLAMPKAMPDRPALREAYLVAAFATGNMLPDAIMQYAMADIEGITLDMGRLQRRRDHMLEALRGLGYEVHTPEATFYLMPRSPIEDEVEFSRRLLAEKVVVLPGIAFEMPGWFRISLTATDDMVERSLPAFERAIKEARA
jgi:aspartate aminotransferase